MTNQPVVYKDYIFDSNEELYFAYWLEELKEAGYVNRWTNEVAPYKLTNGLYHHYSKITHLKTKTKVVEQKQTLLAPSVYTPDFDIEWNEVGREVLYDYLHTDVRLECPLIAQGFGSLYQSIVEVKGDFDAQNMTRHFRSNQKFMWEKYQVYVNLIIPSELFSDTFTPMAYLFTRTGKKRKISKWNPRTLKQFLHDRAR